MQVNIRENSWIARLVALKLRKNCCAIFIGSTIRLLNSLKMRFFGIQLDFVMNCPIRQWKRKGYAFFWFHYLLLSLKYGYHQNPSEKEERNAEGDTRI